MSKAKGAIQLHGVGPENEGQVISLDLPVDGTMPVEAWGTPTFSAEHKMAPVTAFGYFCPEGMTTIQVCTKCGGRSESIIDCRNLSADDSVGIGEYIAAHKAALATLRGKMDEWAESHVSCNETPKSYTMPAALIAAREAAIETAQMTIASGEVVPAIMFVVTREGSFAVPIGSAVSTSDHSERERRSHILRYTVREMLRQKQADVIGVVEITEGWSIHAESEEEAKEQVGAGPISEHPDRTEVLLVLTITPDHGEVQIIGIEREGGNVGEGPGTLSNIPDPEPWNGHSRFSDGLFALDDPLTVPTGEHGAEA